VIIQSVSSFACIEDLNILHGSLIITFSEKLLYT